MINVVLVCQWGASTGMLVEKMLEAAKADGTEVIINAYPESQLSDVIDDADIVLLAPQVRFKQKSFEQKFADKGVDFVLIDTMDYGMLDGEKILKAALNHLKKGE